MAKVTRLWYDRTCSGVHVELKRYKDFIQVFNNGQQLAVFHIKAVRTLLEEGEEDVKNHKGTTHRTVK